MSSSTRFDIARLKQNWSRTAVAPSGPVSDRLASVRPPGDARAEAALLVEEIERDLARDLPDERNITAPFIHALKRRVGTMAGRENEPARSQQSEATSAPDAETEGDTKSEILSKVKALTDVCEALIRGGH